MAKHVCQECLKEFDPDKLSWALMECSIPHRALFCEDCLLKIHAKNVLPFSSRKKRKEIDTSGLIDSGVTTSKGKKKYWFINEGKLIRLVAESGFKRKLKPATEKDVKKLSK